MVSKEEIEKLEQARSNILRGIDLESSALILEKAILDNYIFAGGRVNILKIATRQILNFIENSKVKNVGDKDILDHVKENVSLKAKIKQLKKENQNLKIVQENGLNKEKKYCFNEDGHTGKCLGYSFFNDDEPCIYCQTCDAINIKEEQ
jgi:hypothetical protein